MSTKKQRKILQIITKSNWGGAQKYVYELSKELKKNNENVSVVCGGDGPLVQKLKQADIDVIRINKLGRNINLFKDISVFFELIKIIKKEKPGTIHLHSSKIGAIGALAGRICRVQKVIFTIHGLAFNENRGLLAKIIIKKIYWCTIVFSHKTIAVSENLKSQLFKGWIFGNLFKIVKKKIIVIQNEIKKIDFMTSKESREKISKLIKLDLENKKIIGSLAELHHIKGLKYLISAAAKIHEKDSNCIFVVFGEGEERKRLEKQITEHGLGNKFFLLGFQNNASSYLTGFDVFVLPSLSEGLALSVLEAKQAQIPIICTEVGGLPKALENYENHEIIEPENSQQLLESIQRMIKIENEFKTDNDSNYDEMYKTVTSLYN